mmetsp:Transcript_9673/g.27352  ORF Transcript_9673/g.27352 Transcript_9673/m.27352 type:complete len:209 (-) Transcript_9673:165-791(-)
MALTRTFCCKKRSFAERTMLRIAPLLAAYCSGVRSARKAAMEAVQMIEPPPVLAMAGPAYLIAVNALSTLTLIVRMNSSSSSSGIGTRLLRMPALAKNTSILPNLLTHSSTSPFTSETELTSARFAMPQPGNSELMLSTTLASPPSSMSAQTTRAPWRANSSAVAAPIPLAAPVTTAALPASCCAPICPPPTLRAVAMYASLELISVV